MSRTEARPAPATVARVFARIASNVVVVTTRGPHGCTASVWAEAPDPPLVLVTLRREGETRRRVLGAGRFAVSLLAADQAHVARRFAGPAAERFARGWHEGPARLPVIDNCAGWLACTVESTHPFGAHQIVVGRAFAADLGTGGPVLTHVDGAFGAGAAARGLRPPG